MIVLDSCYNVIGLPGRCNSQRGHHPRALGDARIGTVHSTSAV